MMGAIDPIRSMELVRLQARGPAGNAPADPASSVSVTVSVEASKPAATPAPAQTGADIHLLAQAARVRGLRGGQKVLKAARRAYLEVQYSGALDRRAGAGQTAEVEA
jgi:hypothetical protein